MNINNNDVLNVSYIYCLDSEQSILGSLLIDNDSWYKISDLITIDDFFFKNHKIIFSCMLKFLSINKHFDILLIYNILKKKIFKNIINIFNYLNTLIQKTPNPSNIYNYAILIHNMSTLRKLLFSSKNIINKINSFDNININDFLNKVESEIFNINKYHVKDKSSVLMIDSLLDKVMDKIEFSYLNPNSISGLPTGFNNLDEIISGLHKGELIIIAGRPSMGKTAFAINIAQNIALNFNLPIIIYSMEMSSYQLIIRMLSSFCNLGQHDIITGNITDKDLFNIKKSIKNMRSLKIFIDESINLNIIDIYSKSKRIINQFGCLGLIIIDYLQLISSINNSYNRVMEISEISRNLKCLARELNVPIIAISQLNRSLESRSNKRPIMSDLRESGAIEQDADVILFIYRDEIYNPDSDNKGLAEVIIAKQRNGPIGFINLNFLDKSLKFENTL